MQTGRFGCPYIHDVPAWMYFPYLVGDTFLTAAVPVTPRYFPALPTDLRVPLVIPAAAPRTLPAAARPWETAE